MDNGMRDSSVDDGMRDSSVDHGMGKSSVADGMRDVLVEDKRLNHEVNENLLRKHAHAHAWEIL